MPGNLHDIQIAEDKAKERRGWRMNAMGVYKGDYVEIALPAEEYKRYRRTAFLSYVGVSLVYLGGGFINNAGMIEFFVAIPYVGGVAALIFLGIVLFQLPKKKDKFRLGEEKLSFSRLRNAVLLFILMIAITIGGEVSYLRTEAGGGQIGSEVGFLILMGLVFIAAVFVLFIHIRTGKKAAAQ